MKIIVRGVLAVCLFTAAICASAQVMGRVASGGFDTRYISSDPLTQVIDDGKDTLISLPTRAAKPIVRTVTPDGEAVLRTWVDHDSDVLVIQGLHKKLALSWSNGKSIEVVYGGNRDFAPLEKARPSNVQPAAAVVVAAPQSKTENISPSNAEVISTKKDVSDSAAKPDQSWSVQVEDITLENTLKRWAQQSNHQLLWDTDREIQITAKDEFSGSFEDALNRVLQSPAIRQSEHPLEAVIYANNPPLVRITRLGEQ